MDEIPSTIANVPSEHDLSKLPHELVGSIANPITTPGDRLEVTVEDAVKKMLDMK